MSNIKYISAIGKYVKVKTEDKKCHLGYLKTIDPMSENLVLVNFEELKLSEVIFIRSLNITQLEVLHNSEPDISVVLDELFKEPHVLWNDPGILRRKDIFTKHLSKCCIPFKEVGENSEIIEFPGDALVYPPYEVGDIQTSNTVIGDQVKSILSDVAKEYVCE